MDLVFNYPFKVGLLTSPRLISGGDEMDERKYKSTLRLVA